MTTADTQFYRAFVGRVRETVATEQHARTADLTELAALPVEPIAPVADEATTNRSVDAYLARQYPGLFPASEAAKELPARTVTVRLLDAPGASMTLTCPSWCTTDHAEDIGHGTFAEDFAHQGDESALMVPTGWGNAEDILIVQIHQYPFGKDMREPTAVLWPTLGLSEANLGTNGLLDLAEQLRKYADELDQAGDTLHEAVKEHTAARRDDHKARWSA